MKAKVMAWLLTWFIFAQSTLISYHTEAFVKTESACTVSLLSVCPPSVCPKTCSNYSVVSQNVTNKSCLVCVMSEKYAFWVTLRPQSDRCRRGEAEVRILDFKTTWSEFQMPSQTAPAEAKPRCVYSILKPHGQSFITSPESVQSSCVR